MSIVTIEERKAARVDQIRAGVEILRKELIDYGLAHGGKFWIYRSVTKGQIHFNSDVDILVDFEQPKLSKAIDFVEDICARLSLKVDVQPKSWRKMAFVERIADAAWIIP